MYRYWHQWMCSNNFRLSIGSECEIKMD